jgi:hypothetical protein
VADADRPPIPSHMTLAVWSTLLCFPFTGFIAIVHASRVITLLEAGDRDAARAASRSARRWIIASAVLGMIMYLSTILAAVLLFRYLESYLVNMEHAPAA